MIEFKNRVLSRDGPIDKKKTEEYGADRLRLEAGSQD